MVSERRSGPREGRLSGRSAVAAATFGNLLEWYDFTVYAYFAVLIGKTFFPSPDPASSLVQAFLTFGLGFLARPAGAVLMGAYADRHGRKAALTLTILLMAAGTLVIALAPPAASIGIGGPLLLLAGRALQGFSAGGEVGGALTFMVEVASREKRGLYASLLQASMAGANLLGSFVAFVLTSLIAPDDMAGWGWRLAFLFGVLIAPVGFWLRRVLDETPEYRAYLAERGTAGDRPSPLRNFLTAIGREPGRFLVAAGLAVLWTSGSYALTIFFPIYAQQALGATPRQAFTASVVGSAVMVAACLAGGRLADRIGHGRLLLGLAMLLAIVPHALLHLAAASPTTGVLALVHSLLCILVGLYVGAAPSALSALFPVEIRATGISIAYNLAVLGFGGFAPMILSWLVGQGVTFAPAWYVSVAAALSIPALLAWPGIRQAQSLRELTA